MIEKKVFLQELKKASLLAGQKITKELAEALFDRLKDEHEEDVLKGLKDFSFSGEKLTLGNIWRHILSHRTKRLEEEAVKTRIEEEKAAREFFQREEMPPEIRELIGKFKRGEIGNPYKYTKRADKIQEKEKLRKNTE